jgi:hypothetical protein
MTSLEIALRQINRHFQDIGVAHALVGGLAVSLRTEPRFTRDADLAVSVRDDGEAAAVARSLVERGWRIVAMAEHEDTRRLATTRLELPSGAPVSIVDLLFASSGIEPEVVADADHLKLLPGFEIGVARTGHLIALKTLARDDVHRPQDLVDLWGLLEVASPDDLALARRALELVTHRGFERGRDLAGEFDRLIDRVG